ncbi:MaoC family dehydratase N-terminal domain-containing protein [Streptomyces sp. NPDC059255]|uniref:FAS1-like dehydratase domain-containing protein n=1 Tax=Streptomyces sp. NPDC059255 TaxID=3346793 RepID=UPI0036B64B63
MTPPPDPGDREGRSEEAEDTPDPGSHAALAALLDRPAADAAAPLPPLLHWLCFRPRVPRGELGPDGHPRTGGFLPPVELPRRMWGGGELAFAAPLRTGVPVHRTSVIARVRRREGRSGPLVLVTVDHTLRQNGASVLTERQDLVYRAAPTAAADAPGDAAGAEEEQPPGRWRRSLVPDPVLLFQYSALTFNSHRIHYDRPYAREEEGYPGLVVHAPLTATLLLDHYLRHRPAAPVTGFRFRAVRPAFDGHALVLHATPVPGGARRRAPHDRGRTVMSAEVDAV